MNISIIGYGNMAKALCQGWLQYPDYELQVAAPSLSAMQIQPRLAANNKNVAILARAQAIILAVKPKKMAEVITEIKEHIKPNQILISVAAGLDLCWFAKQLPAQTPVVRAIPNIAAACGQSATPLIANQWVSAEQKACVTTLFQNCGQIVWTQQEKDLDIITALAGSGLAYLFSFIQAMRDGAITLGLSAETANSFAVQTLHGAACLAQKANPSLADLQNQVTSKGGTTAAALEVFAEDRLAETVLKAMRAAVMRSQSLRKED